MIERHYCSCGGQLEASGDAETVKGIAAMFWQAHRLAGHGPTNAVKARAARAKARR